MQLMYKLWDETFVVLAPYCTDSSDFAAGSFFAEVRAVQVRLTDVYLCWCQMLCTVFLPWII